MGQKGERRLVQRSVSKGLRTELVKQDRVGGRKKIRKVKSMRETKYRNKK